MRTWAQIMYVPFLNDTYIQKQCRTFASNSIVSACFIVQQPCKQTLRQQKELTELIRQTMRETISFVKYSQVRSNIRRDWVFIYTRERGSGREGGKVGGGEVADDVGVGSHSVIRQVQDISGKLLTR